MAESRSNPLPCEMSCELAGVPSRPSRIALERVVERLRGGVAEVRVLAGERGRGPGPRGAVGLRLGVDGRQVLVEHAEPEADRVAELVGEDQRDHERAVVVGELREQMAGVAVPRDRVVERAERAVVDDELRAAFDALVVGGRRTRLPGRGDLETVDRVEPARDRRQRLAAGHLRVLGRPEGDDVAERVLDDGVEADRVEARRVDVRAGAAGQPLHGQVRVLHRRQRGCRRGRRPAAVGGGHRARWLAVDHLGARAEGGAGRDGGDDHGRNSTATSVHGNSLGRLAWRQSRSPRAVIGTLGVLPSRIREI